MSVPSRKYSLVRARQREGEGRSLALDGPHADLAAVGRCDVLDDGQSETGASGGPVARRVDAVEPLEDAVELPAGDADALVDDRDLHHPLVGAAARLGGDEHG